MFSYHLFDFALHVTEEADATLQGFVVEVEDAFFLAFSVEEKGDCGHVFGENLYCDVGVLLLRPKTLGSY